MNEAKADIPNGSVTFFAESVYSETKEDTDADEKLEITITPDLHDSDGTGALQTVTERVHSYHVQLDFSREAGMPFSIMDYATTSMEQEPQCTYCQKTFTSRHYHRKHMASGACLRDVRNPRIMCKKCGKKFRDPRDFVRHDNFHRVKEKVSATPHKYQTD